MKDQFSARILTLAALVLAGLMPAIAQDLAVSHTPNASIQGATNTLTEPTGRAVARVNGAVLTDRDLLREMYMLFPYAAQHNGQIPAEMEPQVRKGALQMLIFEELVYQEALRRQMAIPPAKLKTAERDFRAQFSSPSEYQQFLVAQFNGSQKILDEKIKRSLLIDTFLKTEVDAKSTVSLAEARAYYDKNPARFEYPESFAIQTISFLPPEKPTPETFKEERKRAEAALKQAQATTNYEQFGMLAERVSEDDYQVMMGDHKAVDRAKLAPQVVQALLAIKEGQITGIVQVEQALTIVRLNKHIPAGKAKFDDVKDTLRKELQQQKLNTVRAALDRRLHKTAKVEVL
jgi:peptidyl-prolyl cis-trans isomerase SurA